jgi:hypothetical protein
MSLLYDAALLCAVIGGTIKYTTFYFTFYAKIVAVKLVAKEHLK